MIPTLNHHFIRRQRRFGGKTVVAGIVCLIIVAALILGLGPYVAPLPLAALSAIVILVG